MLVSSGSCSCDVETDALLQRTIRTIFSSCTTLTIAHRLHTIADADRVMVLGAGKVNEFDSPARLMAVPGGVYRQLIEESMSA